MLNLGDFISLLALNPFKNMESWILAVLLHISGAIYSMISYVYQIFLVLATGNNIFDDSVIQGLVSRVYTIIGVIVLFLVAYSLLKAMINPDETFKGKQSPTKMIVNVIVSVILIAFIPTIFDFAMAFQNSLLLNNTIGKLLLGTSGNNVNETIQQGGFTMASEMLKAFIIVNDGYCDVDEEGSDNCEIMYISSDDDDETVTYGEMWEDIETDRSFWEVANVAQLHVDGKVKYVYVLDWVAGIFVLVVLIQYCFELAVRLVKLSLYEVIAPLPILCRIIPSDKVSQIFNNWVKGVVATFVDVFIRVAILFFCVMIISMLGTSIDNIFSTFNSASTTAPLVKVIAKALLVLGVLMFCQRAPQMIKELTGFDGGKYNPLNSAKQALAFMGGTAAGVASGDAMTAVTGGYRAYNETAQSGNLRSIGNQYARGRSLKAAKEQGSTFKGRAANGVRRAFGLESTKQVADERLQNNMDINGNPFEVTNDSGVIINYTDKNGNAQQIKAGDKQKMDEDTVAALHEREAQNQLAVSEVNRKIATDNGYKKVNDIFASAKKEQEDIAGSDIAKGKYTLKNKDGQHFTTTYTVIEEVDSEITDPQTGRPYKKKVQREVPVGDSTNGWTQKQWHDWFEANRQNMNADDVARISKEINDSEKVHTVRTFIDNNGVENGKDKNDINNQNQELIASKEKLYTNIIKGASVRDEKGEASDKEFNAIADKVRKSTSNGSDITYDDLGTMKDSALTQNTKIDHDIQVKNFDKASAEKQNAAINDIFTQVEEQKKQEQTSDAYRALQADEAASRINPPQGK